MYITTTPIKTKQMPRHQALLLLFLLATWSHVHAFRTAAAAQNSWSCRLQAAVHLEPKPRRLCLAGESWPRPDTHGLAGSQSDVERLKRRVNLLENLVHDICSALVYCDDVALVEREMLSAGDIFLDLSSNVTRSPLLLRRSVADISRKHGRPVSPPAHSWH
tara:strand:- start:477 stop:962 length:486 start_codon:yes stop_codon:yes gene_type:complete